MKIAIGLEYDGQAFHGWQSQPHGNTVQDVLEGALAAIAGLPVRTHCAGRTDTGVHALAQVAHFDTDVVRPVSAWVRGVNALLPKSIAVLWAHAVPDDGRGDGLPAGGRDGGPDRAVAPRRLIGQAGKMRRLRPGFGL